MKDLKSFLVENHSGWVETHLPMNDGRLYNVYHLSHRDVDQEVGKPHIVAWQSPRDGMKWRVRSIVNGMGTGIGIETGGHPNYETAKKLGIEMFHSNMFTAVEPDDRGNVTLIHASGDMIGRFDGSSVAVRPAFAKKHGLKKMGHYMLGELYSELTGRSR